MRNRSMQQIGGKDAMKYLLWFVCCCGLNLQAAQVYRSVDGQGRIYFSDRPAIGSSPQTVNPPKVLDAKAHQAQQLKLDKLLVRGERSRREQIKQADKGRRQMKRDRAMIIKECENLHQKTVSLNDSWDLKRRSGYRESDKRKFRAEVDYLERRLRKKCR